jgi:hypothetical protein
MKAARFVVSFLAFFSVAFASAAPHQWIVRETLPNGMVDVRVIEEIVVPPNRQDLLPQKMIFNQIMTARESENFHLPRSAQILKSTPGKPLWELSKPQWTQADEDDYSQWFANQVGVDFLSDSDLVADCADMGLLFRWVYARNHQLPIANTLSGSGALFGHFSSSADWDKLPQDPDWKKDERFKAALRYLFNNTFTRTVVADLYPTIVSPQYVRTGSMFMIIRPTSGHTQTLHKVDLAAGITTFWGNEPASIKIFETPIDLELGMKETFGMWRWVEQTQTKDGVEWALISSDKMPGYSANQFGQNFTDPDVFSDWINQQLGIHIADSIRLKNFVMSFAQGLDQRLDLTAMSIPYCYLKPCDPSSQDYANYSTFARDARLVNEQKEILPLIAKLGATNTDVTTALGLLQNVTVIPGTDVTFFALLQDPAALARLNPDPRVSYPERWGITAAMLTPTIALNADAAALQDLLTERTYYVSGALMECAKGCAANDPAIGYLNTTTLDAGIQQILAQTLTDTQASGVDAAAFPQIRKIFQASPLSPAPQACPAGIACTLDDAVFTDAAKLRLPNWSSNPNDPFEKRWGY